MPYTEEIDGIVHHFLRPDKRMKVPTGGRVMMNADWEHAVEFGMGLLSSIGPDILHAHQIHTSWWILESAQRLGIATVYTNHNFGIPCLRSVLSMGDGSLCDGVVEAGKCGRCLEEGYYRRLDRLNEALVKRRFGRALVKAALNAPYVGTYMNEKGWFTEKSSARAETNRRRSERVIGNLSHCITPSSFGAWFFAQIGCPPDRITVLPWHHERTETVKSDDKERAFTITYIGRVSPEKGVEQVFSALERLQDLEPIRFRVTGANKSDYCRRLKERNPTHVGTHRVEWMGWVDVRPLFRDTDVTIIPSLCMDNTPKALIESIAYNTPVVASRIPTMEEYLVEGETGFLAEFGSVDSLASAIRRAVEAKERIREGKIHFPDFPTLDEYVSHEARIYSRIETERTGDLTKSR
jgi:glycosyltransferase involved in cell wall biosynthesis